MDHPLFVLVELLGTLAFASSGAAAAAERRLDLFGVYAVAFLTACGGGIVRDLCLGALAPAGLSDWRYLACSALAATATLWAGPRVDRLKNPVAFFDSLGLAALVAAAIQVGAEVDGRVVGPALWCAIAVCLTIRFLALRRSWRLPVVGRR